jgi:hypothetical protein
MPKMIGWKVYLDGEQIDEVFYNEGITQEEVRISLIEHDGYDPNITVKKVINKLQALKTLLDFVDHILMFQDIHDVQSGNIDGFLDLEADEWQTIQEAYPVVEELYNQQLEVEE